MASNDHKVRVHKEVQEIVFSLKKERLYSLLMKDEFLRFVFYCFVVTGIISVFMDSLQVCISLFCWCSLLILGLWLSPRPKPDGEENSRLVENIPKNRYMLNIGTQVKILW
ncbi:hypothetical protein [Helicobacter sp. T3_23-1059]